MNPISVETLAIYEGLRLTIRLELPLSIHVVRFTGCNSDDQWHILEVSLDLSNYVEDIKTIL